MTKRRVLSRRGLAALAAAGTLLGLSAALAPPAGAVGTGVEWSSVTSPVPFAKTPNIQNGTPFAITQVGNTVVVGGSFTSVQNQGSTTTLTRNHVLAFDATTGAVSTTFAPVLDNIVYSLAPGPVADTVYIGGQFNTVNGVKSKGITLVSTTTGAIVSGFKPPVLNGIVYTLGSAASRLYIAGSFTKTGAIAHGGIATLNPNTGTLDPYMNVQFAGHHNYNGSGANGAVGPRAMSINPAGTRAVVVGNFKTANGATHDQIAMLDLDGASAAVDPNWNTAAYSAPCIRNAFDTYVTDVQYAADGSYFAVTATGGSGGTNTDGSKPLCDSAARWEQSSTGTNVQPSWVDYTGRDSLWSVAVTGAAIYVGGHERWLNNSNGSDSAGAGAVPRPGMAALDPVSGVPMTWNPGRNPRGAGAYALYASQTGLYVGSDTDYIGNRKYKHQKIAYFPLTGGTAPASTATASLPGNVYLAGAANTDALQYNPVNGSQVTSTDVGSTGTVPGTGVSWGSTRGAFMVGNYVFYGQDGLLYRATFDGTTITSAPLDQGTYDPYDDPIWSNINTGSGQTYRGVKPTYLTSELPSVTGAFYSGGRLYYTLAGKTTLFSRWFGPDSGIIGSQEFSQANAMPSTIAGMAVSGSALYYADSAGKLHTRSFSNGTVGSTDTIVDSAHNWSARSLFIYGPPSSGNHPPTARIGTPSCTGLTCTFDGSTSSDPDSDPLSFAWTFGDGGTASGPQPSHTFPASNTYPVTLTVNDGRGGSSTDSTSVTVTGTVAQIAFDGQNSFNSPTSNVAKPSVTVPTGVNSGDAELLFVSVNIAGVTTTAPSGWSQVRQFTNGTLETTVFRRVAASGEAGSTVTVPLSSACRVDLQLVAYSGVADQDPVLATAGDSSTNTHTTPTANVAGSGSWALSYWADRTSAGQEQWALPGSVTQRGLDAPPGGGGRVDSALADESLPTSVSSYGTKTATVTASAKAGKGNMFTVILAPATG